MPVGDKFSQFHLSITVSRRGPHMAVAKIHFPLANTQFEIIKRMLADIYMSDLS